MRSTAIQDKLSLLAKRSGRTLEDVTELWTERAAIREHDGRMRRADADREALVDTSNMVMR